MNSDKISEEKRAEYESKVQALLQKHKREDAKGEEAADRDQVVQNVRKTFEMMMEFERNPNTKAAQEYYKKLSELEKNSVKKRKPATVIIKNMRGGKTLST